MITTQTFSSPTPAHNHRHTDQHQHGIASVEDSGTAVDVTHLGADHPPEIQHVWEGQMPGNPPNPGAAPINASTPADMSPSRPSGPLPGSTGPSNWAKPGAPVVDAWDLRSIAPTAHVVDS